MKEKLILLLVSLLITMSSYGQKFLKKYAKRHNIENLSNGYLALKYDSFTVLDLEGNIVFESGNNSVVSPTYSAENNILYYTIGHKLAKHACFRDTSSDVLCSYNLTTREQKEYHFKDVSYSKVGSKQELMFFFTDIYTEKKGIMKANEEFLFKPEYDRISEFKSSRDLFLIVNDDKYYVADQEGKNILGEQFILNSKTANMSLFDLNNQQCIRGTRDGIHYGLYNIDTKKDVLPFEYLEISDYNFTTGLLTLKKNEYLILLDYKSNKVVIDESFMIKRIELSTKKKGELFIVTSDSKTNNLVNVIFRGKYLFENDFELKIDRESFNVDAKFILGTYLPTGAKVVYDFENEKMVFPASLKWLTDFELLSFNQFEKHDDLYYFTVKNSRGNRGNGITDNKGSCLMPLENGGRISLIEIDADKKEYFYKRVKTDNSSVKITSIYKNCKIPIVQGAREDVSLEYDETRDLFFYTLLDAREPRPEDAKKGVYRSYYLVNYYYNKTGELVDKSERFASSQ